MQEEIKSILNSSNVAAFNSEHFTFPSAIEQHKDKITRNYNSDCSVMGVKLCLSLVQEVRDQDTEPTKEQTIGCCTEWWKKRQ